MLGFFVAFAVKLPMVPLHTWLADAHTEAPTAGSLILAGLLLKTGAYGLLRFVMPLFPDAARAFAPVAMTLAVIGIVYGAVLAFARRTSNDWWPIRALVTWDLFCSAFSPGTNGRCRAR